MNLFFEATLVLNCPVIRCRYQMVTMTHEEASMKIGDVMCLCKVSLS